MVPVLTTAPALRRIALCLQYDGSAYCGWQRQSNAHSVQQTLEQAIAGLDLVLTQGQMAELEAPYIPRKPLGQM